MRIMVMGLRILSQFREDDDDSTPLTLAGEENKIPGITYLI